MRYKVEVTNRTCWWLGANSKVRWLLVVCWQRIVTTPTPAHSNMQWVPRRLCVRAGEFMSETWTPLED